MKSFRIKEYAQFSCKLVFFFLLITNATFSQKRAIKKITTTSKKISISTIGLDDLVLKTTTSKTLDIALFAENPNRQHIVVKEKHGELKIGFKIPVFKTEDGVFRKYITKRLKRATATLQIPANKEITIFGENINITSKSYQGNLRVFIEKGIVKLDTIQQNLELKMYAGSMHAVFRKTNLEVISKLGVIEIDTVVHQKKYREKENSSLKTIAIVTEKGNIFLTHQ